jgi:hypothetical protein
MSFIFSAAVQGFLSIASPFYLNPLEVRTLLICLTWFGVGNSIAIRAWVIAATLEGRSRSQFMSSSIQDLKTYWLYLASSFTLIILLLKLPILVIVSFLAAQLIYIFIGQGLGLSQKNHSNFANIVIIVSVARYVPASIAMIFFHSLTYISISFLLGHLFAFIILINSNIFKFTNPRTSSGLLGTTTWGVSVHAIVIGVAIAMLDLVTANFILNQEALEKFTLGAVATRISTSIVSQYIWSRLPDLSKGSSLGISSIAKLLQKPLLLFISVTTSIDILMILNPKVNQIISLNFPLVFLPWVVFGVGIAILQTFAWNSYPYSQRQTISILYLITFALVFSIFMPNNSEMQLVIFLNCVIWVSLTFLFIFQKFKFLPQQ